MSEPAAAPRCYRHPDREARIVCQRCQRPICPEDMREASVGFQCPECVAQGAAAVRQPRTMAGGAISTDVGRVTAVIIAINVIAQVLVMANGGTTGELFRRGAMWGYGVGLGDQYWRLLTSAFLHGGILHLVFNMYALYLFGPFIERALGRWRFALSYLTVAVASSVVVYWLSPPNLLTIGASGAVFGLFGMALVFLIRTKQNINGMLVLLAINAFISLQANVSWQGHLGGFVTGLLLGAAFAYAPRDKRTQVQVAAFVVIWAAVIGGVALRSAQLLS